MENKLSTLLDISSVDTHFHAFTAGKSVLGARYTPTYAAPMAKWQAAAQTMQVTHGVLVQTSFMGTDNNLLLQLLAAQPDTLRGVVVVSPTASKTMLEDFHAQGVRGIRLNLAGSAHDMSAWVAAKPLWSHLEQLGWHVELHTDAGSLPKALAAVPVSVPVVLDHFAKPEQASMYDATVLAVRHRSVGGGSVHIKLSAAYRLKTGLQPQDLAALWQGELGNSALLWGSDWPCTNHEKQANYAALHQALETWLQGDWQAVEATRSVNPLRLYWG